MEELPDAFVACHGDFLVAGVAEPVGVDEGVVVHVVRLDGEGAPGEGGHQGQFNAAIVVAVGVGSWGCYFSAYLGG